MLQKTGWRIERNFFKKQNKKNSVDEIKSLILLGLSFAKRREGTGVALSSAVMVRLSQLNPQKLLG